MRAKRVLLIDGDVVAYKTACATEKATHWGDDIWTLHCDAQEARGYAEGLMMDYLTELEADEYRIALSDISNFRKRINPDYKSNRKNRRKPLCYNEIKLWMRVSQGACILPTLEADDLLGIWATEDTTEDRIIVSIDKDFKTIPSKRWNPDKPEEGVLQQTKEQANYFHLIQTLAGDSTDGYTGVPRVGPVTADRILGGECSWEKVVEAYEEYGLNEDVALMNARMARILRNGEWKSKTGAKLWTPQNLLD
tara:strand:+ start:408 stop:1160 length:753 start_codon:yes stop_codon:yes gene_type:complete